MTLRPSMAIVLTIQTPAKCSDRVARAEDARDLGSGELVQESAKRDPNVSGYCPAVKAAWAVVTSLLYA
jgi:hypothetical protein